MINCEKAERLIPLFVEADLEATEQQAVSQHLDICLTCRNLAAEFQSSQTWIQAMGVPAFDERLLADLRNAVQQNVAKPKLELASVFLPLWNWKFALAGAVALLLLASGILMQARVGSENQPQVAAGIPPNVVAQQLITNAKIAEKKQASSVFVQHRATSKTIPAHQRKRDLGEAPASETPVAGVDPGIVATAETTASATAVNASLADFLTLAPSTPPEMAAKSETKVAEPEMLRMEIQTADPNIRIIWLTPKEPPARANGVAEPK